MKRFTELVTESLATVEEILPWDMEELQKKEPGLMVLDIREPAEFQAARIPGSVNVPRGILESSCEFGYEDTLPQLARARNKKIVVVCRSGNRSALAADTMQQMGFNNIYSLKTGLRGWNDFELPLVDDDDTEMAIDDMDELFTSRVTEEQKGPG